MAMEDVSTPDIAASAFIEDWITQLHMDKEKSLRKNPNCFVNNPRQLITDSVVHSFSLGTGDDIFSDTFPQLEAAESEIIFVTCFWAKSTTLEGLSRTLRRLSARIIQQGRPPVRVRICFSSLSIFQKLFHTSSSAGYVYPPSTWTKKLQLPHPDELKGLDMEVKSIFIRPFCVMHPKFIILDRKEVYLPSCNVSWEEWFEGCIEFSGSIAEQFLRFHEEFWSGNQHRPKDTTRGTSRPASDSSPLLRDERLSNHEGSISGPAHYAVEFDSLLSAQAVFLPSPHHINPQFRPFFWQDAPTPPPTPLNTFILHLLASASSSIYIQTPNLTSPPVLTAIMRALRCSVDVHIVTSQRLMILEQLVTAGTTTSRCVRKLIKRYKSMCNRGLHLSDVERGFKPGQLRIEYYHPRQDGATREPTQSHLKLTVVDEEWTVLGSGNMDRASWYTSQELGIALHSTHLAHTVRDAVRRVLKDRTKLVFASNEWHMQMGTPPRLR